MPVSYFVDDDHGVFVIRLSEQITKHEAMETIDGLSQAATRAGGYRSLLLLEPTADFSEMDAKALNAIHKAAKAAYRRVDLRRRGGAAVAEAAHHARIILPLWNAICDIDPEFDPHLGDIDLRYTMFDALEPALAWLGIPESARAAAVARAEQ